VSADDPATASGSTADTAADAAAGDADGVGADARGRVARGGLITLAGNVVRGALNFGNEALIARWVGPAAYGLYALAFGVIRIAETASLFGLRVGALHFLPIYRSRGETGRVAGTVILSVALPTVVAAVLAALLWLLAPWMTAAYLNAPGADVYIQWFALSLPLMAFAWMAGVVTWGFGFAHYFVVIKNLVTPLSFLAAICALVLLDVDPLWVAGGFFASHAAASVAGVVVLVRVAGPALRAASPRYEPQALLAYSAPLFLNSLLFMALRWTALLMLGAMADPESVGIYRACVLPLLVLEMIPNALNASSSSVYPVLESEGRGDELRAVYGAAVRWTTAASLFVWVFFFLSRNGVLALLGEGFTAGQLAFAVLVSSQFLNNVTGASGFLLGVTGRQRYETLNAGVAVVVNAGLNLLFIPLYGVLGAAASTAAALVLLNVMRVLQVRATLDMPTLDGGCWRILAAGALFAAVVETAGFVPGARDLLQLLAALVAAAVVLLPATWFFGLAPQDRESISRFLRRVTAGGGGAETR